MDLKIFTNNIEGQALNQCYEIGKTKAFQNAKIRIMPDVHSGKGCVIGFTAKHFDHVIPSVVGCDINCGMLITKLKTPIQDFSKVDEAIAKVVPSGFYTFDEESNDKKIYNLIEQLRCYHQLRDLSHIYRSVGTLGGGNHFIEIDVDKLGNQYIIIHSGSHNLGKQVEAIYTKKAIRSITDTKVEQTQLIQELKRQGRTNEIQAKLQKFKENRPQVSTEFAYLTDEDVNDYYHDVKIVQEYATLNRERMMEHLIHYLDVEIERVNGIPWMHEVRHNYIDFSKPDEPIIRKGAISAKKDEFVLIPLNMRDGCIMGYGKGNPDWNESAPHGAGRILSRSKAKEVVDMTDFTESMKDIYTTSVTESTLDESPFAYKPAQEIIDAIKDTVSITDILKPVYNFKAH